MAAAFNAKKRGLFGSAMPGAMQSPLEAMAPVQQDAASTLGAGPQEPRQGLGTRLLGQGWEDKAFALGGLLRGDMSGAENLMAMRNASAQQAAQLAAEQRKRAEGLADYRSRKEIDQEFGGDADAYTYFEDNAGNRWRQNKQTGQVDANPSFVDTTPKYYVQGDQAVRISNPYAGGRAASNLDNEPGEEDGYRYIPGPGGRANKSNWQAVGGSVGNGAGGFPSRF